MSDPFARRHADYVQVVRLRTPSPKGGGPSLETFAEEHIRTDLSEPEADGYVRISKENAQELLDAVDDYVKAWGPLLDEDTRLVAELREILAAWE